MKSKSKTRTFTITVTGRPSEKDNVPINVNSEKFCESVKADLEEWLNHNYGSVFGIPTFGYDDFVSVEVNEVTE